MRKILVIHIYSILYTIILKTIIHHTTIIQKFSSIKIKQNINITILN